MHRIDHKSASVTMPVIGAPGPEVDGFFSHGNPLTATIPTQVDHDWLNSLQENICYAVEQLGVDLDKADNTQLYEAIQQYIIVGPIGGSGLTSVQGDTDPHLGGNLIVNDFAIVSAGDIVIEPDGSGNIDLNKANIYFKTRIVHRGDTGTRIVFGTDTQDFQIGSTSIFDISASGLRAGGSGTRITTILDEDTMSSNSNTATLTQQSAKAFVDNLFTAASSKYLTVAKSFYAGGGTSDPKAIQARVATSPARYFAGGSPSGSGIPYANYHVNGAIQMPRAATLSNLKFKSANSWATSDAYNVYATLYVNGTATALSVTMATSGGAPNVEDTTHSVSVNQGDYIEIGLDYDNMLGGTNTIVDAEISLKVS